MNIRGKGTGNVGLEGIREDREEGDKEKRVWKKAEVEIKEEGEAEGW